MICCWRSLNIQVLISSSFLLSWCFSFERLHRWMLIVSCKFWNPLRWWLLFFLTVRLWCTSYLCCGCQSLLVIVFQLLWSISSLVQMHHCFPWGLLVCYRWPCAHVHGLSRPHECWLCSTSLPGGHQVDGLQPAPSGCATHGKHGMSASHHPVLAIRVIILRMEAYRACSTSHLGPAVNRQPGYRREDS